MIFIVRFYLGTRFLDPNGTSLYAAYTKILPPDYEAYTFPR